MPTFGAIAFDRLLEPGASKPVDNKSAPTSTPIPNSNKLGRSTSAPPTKKKAPHPQLKPALYATPEVTPLPDSPSPFPPSPYIINHKRRGPRLLKSSSEANVLSKHDVDEKATCKSSDVVVASSAGNLQITSTNPEPVKEEQVNGVYECELGSSNGGDLRNGHNTHGYHCEKILAQNLERDVESEDFFDPQDSMSFTSNTDGEENTGTEQYMKFNSPGWEFYDACEELLSESGTQKSPYDVEAELREMRLSLLMEIKKQKQAEESINNMQSKWGNIRQVLSLVGIILPKDLTGVVDSDKLNSDLEDLHQQVYVTRFISNAIGRGTAKAEAEMEMEAQLELKNFEIARLLERLHYYETMNREMSQRNQEAVGMARCEWQRRSRRQRWIWGSITTAVLLGTAALAWSYLPMGEGSSSADHDLVPEQDDAAT